MASVIKQMSIEELVVNTARELVGKARYVYRHEECEPPYEVSCSVLVQWAFMQCKVDMPPMSSQLLRDLLYLGEPADACDLRKGHLVFTAGRRDECRDSDRAILGVGHVGISTGDQTVVHASFTKRTVVEEPTALFLGGVRRFRGCFKVH